MANKKRIKRSNLPAQLPFSTTALALLALRDFKASDLVCGITYTLLVIVWLNTLYSIATDTYVDVIDSDNEKDH